MTDLYQWRRLLASEYGPKSPITRLLLHTLMVHMDQSGGSCFPSTKTIAVESGLSERSVCSHLNTAEKTGWIHINQKSGSGRAWKSNSYQAEIPINVLKEIQHLEAKGTERGSVPAVEGTERSSVPSIEGTEIGSVPVVEGTERPSEGTERGSTEALKEDQSSYTLELFSNNTEYSFLLADGTEFVIDNDFFAILASSYPTVDIGATLRTIKAWAFANPSKRKKRAGAMRFVNSWFKNETAVYRNDHASKISTDPGAGRVGKEAVSKYDKLDQAVINC